MKRKLFLLIIFFAILLLGFNYLQKRNFKPPVTDASKQISWRNISPGQSTVDELEKLGVPVKREKIGKQEILYYPSDNQFYFKEVNVKENVVVFIRIQLFSKEGRSLKDKIEDFGPSYTVLYGPNTNSGILLYMYPDKGIAFLANEMGDLIFETWYFSPATLEEFLSLPQTTGYSTIEIQKLD